MTKTNWNFGRLSSTLKSKICSFKLFIQIIKKLFSQFRQDRVNIIPTTRTSTGKLPLPRQLDIPDSSSNRSVYVTQKIASGDMKDKIEQQLRLQREANNKKRAEELKQGL